MIRSGYISCGLSQRRKLLISKEGTSWFGRRICFSFQHREYSLKVIKTKRKEKKKATNNLCHLLDAGRPPHLSRKWKLCDLSFASNVFSFTSHSFFFFPFFLFYTWSCLSCSTNFLLDKLQITFPKFESI